MALSDNQRIKMYSTEEIGNVIKKRRRQLKITQKELADRLNIGERTIQKYESGEIAMKIGVIKLIAEELDIPWQELLEAKTEKIGIVEPKDESPDYRFHTLADVIKALFTITSIKDISFSLTCNKPPESPEWNSALMVNGKGNGTYNADFCLFMENWMNKLAALQNGSITEEKFEAWKLETLNYYSDSYFSDFTSQIAKDKKAKGKKKKSGISSIQIVSTLEEPDNE